MNLNKRPATEAEQSTVRMVEKSIMHGLSLNRACHQHKISTAGYYRKGGRPFLDLAATRTAVAAK